MAFNAAGQSGYQSTYGSGLGGIQAYGYGNPYGPYASLPHAAGTAAPGGVGGTTSTATAGPTNSAMDFFGQVLSGQKLPYGKTQTDSLYSSASDMAAQAEGSQMQQALAGAAAGGAAANDPSMRGMRANLMAQRQGANQKSRQDIDSKAGSANFGAQMDAAGAMNQYSMEQQRLAAGQNNAFLRPYSGGGGGGKKGGNNFGSNQGFLGYQNANLGTFRAPATHAASGGGAGGGPSSWSDADWGEALGYGGGSGGGYNPGNAGFMDEDYVPTYGSDGYYEQG